MNLSISPILISGTIGEEQPSLGFGCRGPDYSQWHGAYEILHDLAELQKMVGEKLESAGLEE